MLARLFLLFTLVPLVELALLIWLAQATDWRWALLLAVVGWCGITSLTLSNTLLQIIVPDGLRGRVLAVYMLMIGGVSQLAGLLLGSLAEATGDVALTVRVWTALGRCIQLALLVTQGKGSPAIHSMIATALAAGLAVLLGSALMTFVLLSSRRGHDEVAAPRIQKEGKDE